MKKVDPNWIYGLAVLLALVFYLWLAAQVPYTHDDWDWGLAQGVRHLLSADINSRYAGNLLEVILTRSVLCKTLVMGLVFTLLPLSAAELAAGYLRRLHKLSCGALGRLALFLLANGLLLCLPADIWSQTYGWVAGFSNFVISGLFLLFYLALLMARTEGKDPPARPGPVKLVLVFCFGVVAQLFLENLSACLTLLVLVFLVLEIIRRRRRPDALLLALLAGTLVGLGIMFSSSMYQTLWDTGAAVGDYRQLTFRKDWSLGRILASFLRRYVLEFLPPMLQRNGHLAAALSLLLLLSGLHALRTRGGGRWPDLALLVLDLAVAVYFLVSRVRAPLDPENAVISGTASAIDVGFLVLVTLQLIRYGRRNGRQLLWLMLVWLLPFLLMAPMVVINTVGSRSYFTTDLCLVLLCLFLLAPLWRDWPGGVRRGVLAVCLVLALVPAVRWCHIYGEIGAVSRARSDLIRQARAGEITELTLPAYPYRQYLQFPDPNNEYRAEYFRAFYGIPDGVELHFESMEP